MGIIWTIVIGFLAGVIAKFVMLGSKEPSGFVLTTILGNFGAIVASYLGQALSWYAPGEGGRCGSDRRGWWCAYRSGCLGLYRQAHLTQF